jgi:hypothetical protein
MDHRDQAEMYGIYCYHYYLSGVKKWIRHGEVCFEKQRKMCRPMYKQK